MPITALVDWRNGQASLAPDSVEDLIPKVNELVSYTADRASVEAVSAAGSVTKAATFVTCGAADRVMVPPTAVNNEGLMLTLVKVDAAATGKLVIDPVSSQTIDGAATLSSPASAVASIRIVSDGTNWWSAGGRLGTWT